MLPPLWENYTPAFIIASDLVWPNLKAIRWRWIKLLRFCLDRFVLPFYGFNIYPDKGLILGSACHIWSSNYLTWLKIKTVWSLEKNFLAARNGFHYVFQRFHTILQPIHWHIVINLATFNCLGSCFSPLSFVLLLRLQTPLKYFRQHNWQATSRVMFPLLGMTQNCFTSKITMPPQQRHPDFSPKRVNPAKPCLSPFWCWKDYRCAFIFYWSRILWNQWVIEWDTPTLK